MIGRKDSEKSNELAVSEYLGGAAILAAGAKLIRVDAPGAFERKCRMIFNDEGGAASELLMAHLRGTLKVSSLEMADAIQSLKTRLFAARAT